MHVPQAAFWSLIGGFVVGIIRMGLDFGMKPPRCGSGVEDTRPQLVIDLVDKFHFLHFGGFLFALTCLMAYVIAILTSPIPGEKVTLHISIHTIVGEFLQVENGIEIHFKTKLFASETLRLNSRYFNLFFDTKKRGWNNILLTTFQLAYSPLFAKLHTHTQCYVARDFSSFFFNIDHWKLKDKTQAKNSRKKLNLSKPPCSN